MRVHSDSKIRELKFLRQKGYSINEIVSKLHIPKTTVWHHIKKVHVFPRYLSLLQSKRGGSRIRKESRLLEARIFSKDLLKSKDRESVLMFAMLYWAEGAKKRFQFINSDGRMVTLWLDVLRNVLKVSNKNIVPVMRIFTGMNKKTCLKYWSEITEFPGSKFVVRYNDGGTSGRTKYGMCRIEVKKSGNLLKLVLALINEVCLERDIS